MSDTNHKLSQNKIDQFRKQGYLGPYTLCSPEDMWNMQPEIEKFSKPMRLTIVIGYIIDISIFH